MDFALVQRMLKLLQQQLTAGVGCARDVLLQVDHADDVSGVKHACEGQVILSGPDLDPNCTEAKAIETISTE